MPLVHGYCVVAGTLNHYERDPLNNFGQYYHENLYLDTPEGQYHCAIDVDSKQTNDGINWRVVPLAEPDLKGVAGLSDGRHDLPYHHQSGAESGGAVDNIRAETFHRPGCIAMGVRLEWIGEWWRQMFNAWINPPWSEGDSKAALNVFEPLLDDAKRIFVFGEPFHFGGLGVHNVHQNQGDLEDSQWWNENGIWQDGATILKKNDNFYVAFLTKFKPQADNTNPDGHPV